MVISSHQRFLLTSYQIRQVRQLVIAEEYKGQEEDF